MQTLLAREIADDKNELRPIAVRHLINGSIFVGGIVATSLSLMTYFQRHSVMQGLTSNPLVRDASLAIFPAVLATQGKVKILKPFSLFCTFLSQTNMPNQNIIEVMKGLAYPVNGINMGGLVSSITDVYILFCL